MNPGGDGYSLARKRCLDRNLPERYREGRAGDGRSPYFMGE
jgi:hypothetical protein